VPPLKPSSAANQAGPGRGLQQGKLQGLPDAAGGLAPKQARKKAAGKGDDNAPAAAGKGKARGKAAALAAAGGITGSKRAAAARADAADGPDGGDDDGVGLEDIPLARRKRPSGGSSAAAADAPEVGGSRWRLPALDSCRSLACMQDLAGMQENYSA
jgi:hypothetical protein